MNETRLEIDDFPIPVGDDESVADRVVWRFDGPVRRGAPLQGHRGGRWIVRGVSEQAHQRYLAAAGVDGASKPVTIGQSLARARQSGAKGVLIYDETLTVVAEYRV